MIKKESNFFEKHVEKLVLLAAGVVSIWILFSFVIVGPNNINFANQEFGPMQIDDYILNNPAEKLESILNKPPVPKGIYVSKMTAYTHLLDSALVLDDGLYPSLPGPVEQRTAQPKYALPVIPDIDRASVEHIRTVAYMPFREVDQKNPYSSSTSEANDIDLVTVEFRYNIQNLYKSFRDSFEGLNLPDKWRDSTLAEPVFAAVQLQRQQQNDDGTWSDWIDVPRSKIDKYRKLLGIIENVQDLPTGGLKRRILEYRDKAVQVSLLQPDYYRIASANEEWFPPSLHEEYNKIRGEIETRRKREARQAELEKRKASASTRLSTAEAADLEALRAMRNPGGYGNYYQTPSTSREDQAAFNKIYQEYDKLSINEKIDLSGLSTDLIIWAFDDTVQPGTSCRYRVRVGIFNPIAGTDEFADPNDPLKNKVILWSSFCRPYLISGYARMSDNNVVKIPEKLYLFAKDIEQAIKRVTVTVCKYRFGYWHSSDFKVMPGDTIGKLVENTPGSGVANAEEALDTYRFGGSVPRVMDYSSGAVMVDALDVNDWITSGGRLSQRFYWDMLYSFDNDRIEQMPVGLRYWPVDIQTVYSQIRSSMDQPKRPLQNWTDKGSKRQESQPTPMPGIDPTMQKEQQDLLELYRMRQGYGGPPR